MTALFIVLAAVALCAAVAAFWMSFRAALAGTAATESLAVLESEKRTALHDRKSALLESLRDLDFDRQIGKISDDDHRVLETGLRREAREVLRLLDEDLGPYRARAEALVADRLGKASGASPYRAESPKVDAATDGPSPEPALACARCAARNDADAAFCKKCGAKLTPDHEGLGGPEPTPGREAIATSAPTVSPHGVGASSPVSAAIEPEPIHDRRTEPEKEAES